MDSGLPKVKTIRVMLCEMDEQQDAMFRMAFKMHNITNYEIVDENSAEKPDMLLVDVDSVNGIQPWNELKKKYSNIPVVMFSKEAPVLTTPYLQKPIKFDTLFPILRNLAQGGHVYDAEEQKQNINDENDSVQPQTVKRTTIRRFNPKLGLLGALKAANVEQQDTAVLVAGKPILIVFPSIQRVLLTVGAEELERMCCDDKLAVVCKTVPDNPQWKEKAKVTIMSCLWQMAIWTAQGRLVYPLTPQTVFTLKRWPNLTRLAPLPESMRLSAFLTKTSVNLNILYKVMPLDMPDILNYLAATHATGFLATDSEFTTSEKEHTNLAGQVDVTSEVPDSQMAKDAQNAVRASQEQPRGLLQRIMRKLSGK